MLIHISIFIFIIHLYLYIVSIQVKTDKKKIEWKVCGTSFFMLKGIYYDIHVIGDILLVLNNFTLLLA